MFPALLFNKEKLQTGSASKVNLCDTVRCVRGSGSVSHDYIAPPPFLEAAVTHSGISNPAGCQESKWRDQGDKGDKL